jgi:hypothetical protein
MKNGRRSQMDFEARAVYRLLPRIGQINVINVARHLINWKLVSSVQTGKQSQHYGCPSAMPHDPIENIQLGTYLHVERIPFGRLARAATQDFAASTMTLKVPPHKRHDRHAKSIMKRRG